MRGAWGAVWWGCASCGGGGGEQAWGVRVEAIKCGGPLNDGGGVS